MIKRFFNWRGRQRPFTCNDIEARLAAYEDGRLPTKETAAFKTHLSGCEQCRQLVQAGPGWLAELREAPAPVRLTRAERREMQQALAKRMRRKMIMRDFRLSLQNMVAVAAVLLIVGGLVWWQTADFSQPEDEAVATTEPAATQPAESGDIVTIILAVESGNQSRYQPLIDAFEQEHPGIQVRLVSVNEVVNPDEDGIRALASSFDVFPYSPNRQAETQYLLDLRPFLTLDPNFDAADFYHGLLPAAPEPLYAMPTGAAYYLIYFDKTAFDAVGRPYPALEWTTEEFLETAVALTAREGDEVTRWGYVPAQMHNSPLLAAQLNAPLQTADGLRLQDPDVAEAVSWISDLFAEYQVAPWLDAYRPADRRSGGDALPMVLIANGQAALWPTTHLLYDANEAHVGVTAVPQGEYGLAAEPLITGFAVSRGTANPEAAWALLDFLSHQPPQDNIFQVAPVPARRSVAAATDYWAQLPEDLAPVLQYTADNSVAPRVPIQAAEPLMTALAANIDDETPAAIALGQLPAPEATPTEAEVEPIVVPTAPATADPNVIEINYFPGETNELAHRRLARQFQEEHPDIRVRFLGETIMAGPVPPILERAAGSDCFVGNSFGQMTDNQMRTLLLPVEPLLDLDANLQLESFYPALLPELTVDGALYGIPAAVSIRYLDYNRRLFAEAGVPEPTNTWTIDDFLAAAGQLTKGEGETKQYGFALPLGTSQSGFVDFQVIDRTGPVPDYNYTAVAEMITWNTDLILTRKVQPLLSEQSLAGYSQFQELLRTERIAMWPGGLLNSLRNFSNLPLPDIDAGIVANPVGPNGSRVFYQVSYYIFADSPHPEACWEWIKFLTTKPTAFYQEEQTISWLPAHIETAESEAYVELVGEEMAAIGYTYISQLQLDPPPRTPPWMDPGGDWLREASYAVASGESDIASAVAAFEAKFSQYRQCVIEQDAFEDEAAQEACETSVE